MKESTNKQTEEDDLIDFYWNVRIPRRLENNADAYKAVRIWQWATVSQKEVWCDGCGVPVTMNCANAMIGGSPPSVWVDVFCEGCWSRYADE